MSAPSDELETLSDAELLRRNTQQLSPLQHSILNAEIQRRQMARTARTVKLAAIAAGAAATSAAGSPVE